MSHCPLNTVATIVGGAASTIMSLQTDTNYDY